MVADRFDMAGWTTYFLGPDTPVAEIADAARRLGADAVVMNSHRLPPAGRAARRGRAGKELPGADIWVGGPAFMGAATGWLPEEIVNLDELLGEPAPAAVAADGGAATDAADDGAGVANDTAVANGDELL